MKIVPTGDKILGLVTGLTALGERDSTIFIPEQAKEKKLVQVIVLEVGPKVEVEIPPPEGVAVVPKDVEPIPAAFELKKGDIVLVNNFAGTRVKYNPDDGDEEELILVAAREILAVVLPEVETE